MRKRAGALYLKDHKLLLISEGGQNLYWTPGGGLELGETFRDALKRELVEELSATLLAAESLNISSSTSTCLIYQATQVLEFIGTLSRILSKMPYPYPGGYLAKSTLNS
jgi:8-oxo-dGTP pyrophosphatase MutT (NUDIX family)